MGNLTMRDAPVQEPEDGCLGLSDYAEVLEDFIEDCETPLTIGIQGDWGSGKTSLINMIQTKLDNTRGKATPTPYVNFNTWQFSLFGQEQNLPIACIRALVEQIEAITPEQEQGFAEKAKQKADSIKGTLGRVAKSVEVGVGPLSVSAQDAFEGEASAPEEEPDFHDIGRLMVDFKSQFAELVELVRTHSASDRVVVFIDDLDRVKPVRALELLEVLKNFLDVPGCVFVLAVDYEIVQIGMQQKLGKSIQQSSGKSFFDKIINVPFNIPTTSYELADYIQELFRESGFFKYSMSGDEKAFFEQVTSVTVGRNPRNIKRVINYADLLDRVRSRSVSKSSQNTTKTKRDMRILYALMCMQIEWPELFRFFAENPTAQTVKNLEDWEFLENRPETRRVLNRADDVEQTKSDIGAFVDELFRELDENDDGRISHREMEPVLRILRFARLTTAETAKTPLEQLMEQVEENGGRVEVEFIDEILRSSSWGEDGNCEYKKSGSRYWSIVLNRRQVGSMVTLKSHAQKLIFRLKPDITDLLSRLERILRKSGRDGTVIDSFENIVEPIEDPSLTGFGQVRVKSEELNRWQPHEARTALNWLFRAMEVGTQRSEVSLAELPGSPDDRSENESLSENSVVDESTMTDAKV